MANHTSRTAPRRKGTASTPYKETSWQSYICSCGNLACRLVAQPCGKCGRMLGPVTNKSQKRQLLKSLGWRRSGSHHWRGRDGRLLTFGAAYRTAVAGIPRVEGKKESDIGIIRPETGTV